MTIFGKRLSEYVAFSKPFLGLILVVGIVRFGLSLFEMRILTSMQRQNSRRRERYWTACYFPPIV